MNLSKPEAYPRRLHSFTEGIAGGVRRRCETTLQAGRHPPRKGRFDLAASSALILVVVVRVPTRYVYVRVAAQLQSYLARGNSRDDRDNWFYFSPHLKFR